MVTMRPVKQFKRSRSSPTPPTSWPSTSTGNASWSRSTTSSAHEA